MRTTSEMSGWQSLFSFCFISSTGKLPKQQKHSGSVQFLFVQLEYSTLQRETDRFLVVVNAGAPIQLHSDTPFCIKCEKFRAKNICLHSATFKRYRNVQVEPGRSSLSSSLLLHPLAQSDPTRAFCSPTCSWWSSCLGLLRLGVGSLMSASVLVMRWRGRRTRRPAKLLFKPPDGCTSTPSIIESLRWCRVSAVGGSEERLQDRIEARRGRWDPGQTRLFTVRGALPSWVTCCPGGYRPLIRACDLCTALHCPDRI